jgi:aldehyde:ferredoxin oxidoreductase
MTIFGYAGKILRIDLSSGSTSEVSTLDYVRFLGGRGLAAKIYWDEVSPKINAFDADNRLIFATGPLAGLPVLGSSRWTVCGKSPAQTPGQFCYGNLGGRWGAELKFAGYDAIVVQGKSEKPVYLFLHDDTAELRDASALWGKGSIETREALKGELGSSVKVVAIGPAGENMAIMANLLADNDASGSGGLGAVMGSKRLKAIVVKGAQKGVKVAQPERLGELTRYFRGLGKGVFIAWGTDYLVIDPKMKKDPCYGCLGNCLRRTYEAEDGKKGKFMCQSALFYKTWAERYYGAQNNVPFYATKLCDDYGLDTWAIEPMMLWLNRCYKAGILTDEGTGIPISKLGSLEFIETLVRKVSLREGFGDILAQGIVKAAHSVGAEAREPRYNDPYEPRLYITTALLHAMEPRLPIQQIHEVGLPVSQWVSWVKKVKGAYISTAVLRAIAQRFWGGEIAADFSTYKGKALAAKKIQDRQYAKECLILCDWLWPIMDIEYSKDHVGDPTLESQVLSAVTGDEVDEEELYKIGEKVFNLQRAILIREGRQGREDDKLPEDWHTRPLKRNPANIECLVPGEGGKVISRKGAVVDREEFERMKDEYYQLRQWDVATGLQTKAKLKELGLEDVARDLGQRGLIAKTKK